jgi:hypothetical protein
MSRTPGWSTADLDEYRRKQGQPTAPPADRVDRPTIDRAQGPNKTEAEFLAIVRAANPALADTLQFEGRTFDVAFHTYTPDWYGYDTAIEVKGDYIHSRDSRILFDAARHEHPELTWVWARKRAKGRKGPRWEIEVYEKNI